VTACELVKEPVAIKVEVEVLVMAQKAAVPVPLTVPSVIAVTTTLRPSGVWLVGEPTPKEVLFPRVYVEVA
jgi:hypothetical protein